MNDREIIEKIIEATRITGLAAFTGETQLAGWQETHNSGAKVTLWLPGSEELAPFKGMTARKGGTAGQRLLIIAFEVGDDEQPVTQPVKLMDLRGIANVPDVVKEPSLAYELHRTGYFRNPKLWIAVEARKIYTQTQHKIWIELRACDWLSATCGGDIVGHHCRTAANSGTGIKPDDWFLVSLCQIHHDAVHRTATREQRGKLTVLAVSLTSDQMKKHIKEYIGLDSLSEITTEHLTKFEEEIDLGSQRKEYQRKL